MDEEDETKVRTKYERVIQKSVSQFSESNPSTSADIQFVNIRNMMDGNLKNTGAIDNALGSLQNNLNSDP